MADKSQINETNSLKCIVVVVIYFKSWSKLELRLKMEPLGCLRGQLVVLEIGPLVVAAPYCIVPL
jgi:hypothetical protein